MQDGHPDQAIADFDEAIRIYPDFAPAWANRALARARLGQVDLALDEVPREWSKSQRRLQRTPTHTL